MTAMLAFADAQLRAVWAAADRIPFEKRGVFVERVIARLQRQRGFTDADLDDAVRGSADRADPLGGVTEPHRP
jgi:hypothetical protein